MFLNYMSFHTIFQYGTTGYGCIKVWPPCLLPNIIQSNPCCCWPEARLEDGRCVQAYMPQIHTTFDVTKKGGPLKKSNSKQQQKIAYDDRKALKSQLHFPGFLVSCFYFWPFSIFEKADVALVFWQSSNLGWISICFFLAEFGSSLPDSYSKEMPSERIP